MTDTNTEILGAKPSVPEHVLFQEVTGNAALLNLETETYFGLDEVGTRMWETLEQSETVAAAAASLAEHYDAPPETIEHDLVELVKDLRKHGLIALG